jgi:hypothetical protein
MSNRTLRLVCGLLVGSIAVAGSRAAGAKPPQAPAPEVKVEGLVKAVKVLPDKAPDCSSLKSIAQTVTRDCKTNDEKAIAIYNFMLLSHYHRQYPSEKGGVGVLKEINTYGWSLCGGLHSEQSALWRELGWEWRFVGWSGHTTVEAKYDGRWHYLDAFLKFYAWMPDASAPGGRTIAGEDDLDKNAQTLIRDAFVLDKSRSAVYAKDNQFEIIGEKANWTAPALLVCGDTIDGVVEGLRTHRGAGSPEGWAGIIHATGSYSADVDLAPGFSLTNTWGPLADDAWFWAGSKIAPKHTCGNKDLRNSPDAGMILEPYYQLVRSYANGTLMFAPDFGGEAVLKSFAASQNVKYQNGSLVAQAGTPASVTVLLASPYIMTKASGTAEGAESLEISIDGGKSFKPADLKDFTEPVKGQVSALARIGFKTALKSLKLELLVQNNSGSLPYLSPGRNVVTVSAGDPAALGDNKLVVTYAYAPGYRNKSFEQLCNEGKELAKQHNATWADTPTVVQKVFTAKDLPAKFDIDVPTPKDKHPVYPRMLFVRREVIAPNSKPLVLPDKAEAPKIGPNDELKALPNPFLIGSQPPPQRIARPTRTVTIDLKPGHFVTKAGEVPTSDFIKWPKTEQEKVDSIAFLIGGELTGLAAPKDLAGARLVFPTIRAHPEASTKVGVVALKAPFEAGQKYDFANLGDVLGTVVIGKLAKDAPDWDPPKEFKVDVTRAIRAVAAGEAKFNGFALRVVPDRGVDEGWTVRIHIPKKPKVYLEIDTYAEAPPPPK